MKSLKPTPLGPSKVPPQFEGQSSWFEYEDLMMSFKNALVGAASFYKSMLDNAVLREGSKSCVPLAVPPDFSHVQRPERIRALDRAF